MHRAAASWALIALVLAVGCGTAELTERERLVLFASELDDAIDIARPFIDESGQPYLDAAEKLTDSVANGETGVSWGSLFDAIRATETVARDAMVNGGKTAGEADAILAAIRLILRRLETLLLAT